MTAITLGLAMLLTAGGQPAASLNGSPSIVFVCEHGAAKSLSIGQGDVAVATHIFAIGCALPAIAASSGKAADWSDVPDGKGYGPMRDAIVVHVRALLDEIQRRTP